MPFVYPFTFTEEDASQVHGTVELAQPLPYQTHTGGSGFFRPGRLLIDGCQELEIVLYHSQATADFIYLRKSAVQPNLMKIIGLPAVETHGPIALPGQLCLGSDRTQTIGQAMVDLLAAPPFQQSVSTRNQEAIAIFPIAREGLKYQIAESLYANNGYFCDEILLDAHHVFDLSVPVYNRKVEMTLFKDKDLDQHQREKITLAIIADSIASGLVMKEVIQRVNERFEHIEQVEVVSPLATVRGLVRIARSACPKGSRVRVHVFETLLNALPPDYYFSAHFPIPEFHICPDLEAEYRSWWGQDASGNWIADTACAGYGWSEVFFSPRKQLEMINGELHNRHNLSISEIVQRNQK